MHVVPPSGRSHGPHAVVIGASIGGLLAARVLSSHFDRVTVLDRDSLPDGIENRRGVPQGRHGHGLLASGLRGLKALFPRLEADLLEGGAVAGDVIGDVRWFQHGYYKAKFQSGFDGLLLSRPLLEVTIRRQVLRLPNVTILDNSRVLKLLVERGRVLGVYVQQFSESPFTMTGDLIVDASGRSSRTPDWLQEEGYGKPAVEEVSVGIGYTTRTYNRSPSDLEGDMGVILAPKPPRQMRIGFMLAMEGNRWMVTQGGWMGNHCPADAREFLAFSRTLVRPDIYEVIKHAEPLTDAVTFAFPSNLRRRYDKFTQFPGNYLVIGDAVCSFNPLYGQGMSVATLEALALKECLETEISPETLWRPFFKVTRPIIDGPWTIAAGSDFAFEGVTGARPAGTSVINWYLERVHKAASVNRDVCRTFFDVANLLKPAPTLFHPAMVGRVARECLFPRQSSRAALQAAVDGDRRRLIETH